jgi:serine/threonine protein kinase
MPLSPGARLGAYEIIGPLGAGGMGDVYRALDSSLGRDVAIKVLPEAVAHHPERLARFEREARLLASLSHPNIAVVHGLERSAGSCYLVMELVKGETLAERSTRGAIPLQETLDIFKQITLASPQALETGRFSPVALSPDGGLLVYAAATDGGRTSLFLRPLDELSARLIPATEGRAPRSSRPTVAASPSMLTAS